MVDQRHDSARESWRLQPHTLRVYVVRVGQMGVVAGLLVAAGVVLLGCLAVMVSQCSRSQLLITIDLGATARVTSRPLDNHRASGHCSVDYEHI